MKSAMKRFFTRKKPRERIYCFPNGFGFTGFAVFLIMLAAGGTYQNNLVFMMAFLYLSLGLVAILQTARTIRDVHVTQIHVAGGFPNQEVDLMVLVKNPTGELKLQIELRLHFLKQKIKLVASEVAPHSYIQLTGRLKLPAHRGLYKTSRVGLYTRFPYSLFTAWKYSPIQPEIVVYPTPLGQELADAHNIARGEDFSGHKKYEPGDSPNRMDWKLLARKGEHFVREFRDGGQHEVQITWSNTQELELEARLSQLSRWILSAENYSYKYDVLLPGFHSGAGQGVQHFKTCMEALSRIN